MSLLIRDCNIIDATTPEVRRDQYLFIEGDTIREVGSGRPPSADRTIDLGGTYLLPGLWDVHTHLNKGTWGPELIEEAEGPAKSVMNHGRHAMEALESGVTSLRVVGIANWADVAWREAFAAGKFRGPRLFCCGHGLNTPAGHMEDYESEGVVNGPGAFVKAVRNEIMHGVDQIKLVTTGGIMGTGHDVMHHVMFTREEVEAAIRIATQRGVPVATHATSPQAVKWAVNAGTHSLEHGYILDEEAVSMMAKKGVYYVPTLALSHLTEEQVSTPHQRAYCQVHTLPEEYAERANQFAPGHEESFRMAVEAGVKIACGSDQGPPKEAALLEIELLSSCGLGPYGAIVAATRTSAEVCKVEDKLGTLEQGKLADMIAVEVNPLEDIHNLRRQTLVVKGGEVVVDRL
ncbi:MAG: amidohydrolase family protein [Dehalococcoidia bacterium]